MGMLLFIPESEPGLGRCKKSQVLRGGAVFGMRAPLSSGAHGWAHPAPPRDPRCGHPTAGIHRGTGFGIPPGADTEVMMDLGWDAGTVPRSGDIPVPGTRTIVPGGSGSPRCLEAEGCEVGAETPRRGAGAPKQSPSVCAH